MRKHINKTWTCNFERCLRYRRVEDLQLLNDIHSDSGKDVSDFIFPWDKQRRKRTPYLLWAHCFRPSSLVSNPKWRPHDKGTMTFFKTLACEPTLLGELPPQQNFISIKYEKIDAITLYLLFLFYQSSGTWGRIHIKWPTTVVLVFFSSWAWALRLRSIYRSAHDQSWKAV